MHHILTIIPWCDLKHEQWGFLWSWTLRHKHHNWMVSLQPSCTEFSHALCDHPCLCSDHHTHHTQPSLPSVKSLECRSHDLPTDLMFLGSAFVSSKVFPERLTYSSQLCNSLESNKCSGLTYRLHVISKVFLLYEYIPKATLLVFFIAALWHSSHWFFKR